MKRVHGLLNTGHNEVVDCDLSNYFGEIPHAELLRSFARRISDGRMLKLIKAWLEMPVEEDDGGGGKRRTNRARRERKGTPQGSPISLLASGLYMRRFVLGWKALGYARRLRAEIVNYADDLCVLGNPFPDLIREASGIRTRGADVSNPIPNSTVTRRVIRVKPDPQIVKAREYLLPLMVPPRIISTGTVRGRNSARPNPVTGLHESASTERRNQA